MKKVAIGIDIGGTSVKLGIVNSKGKILHRSDFLTKNFPGREKFLKALTDEIGVLKKVAVKKGFEISGVGIGAPGPIRVEDGFVYFFPNIPGWKNTPFKKILTARLRMPVYLDNDANAMALAEYAFGAGKDVKNLIALTLGTGIGGGIVLNGKLFHGPAYSAAEIGHMTINEDGPLCACGSRGCIEAYVGNGYLIAEIQKRLKSGRKSILTQWIKEGKVLTPKTCGDAARAGDVFSQALWMEMGEHLATAIAALLNILNPEKIILGGGIAQNTDLLFPPLKRSLKKKAFPIAFRSVRVVPAALGVDAGLIGAAALVYAG